MAVTLIRIGGEGFNYGSHHREYLMDSAEDVTSLPGIDECSPGSRAYTVDGKSVYRMDSTGAWVLSSSGGGGGGGGGFEQDQSGGRGYQGVVYIRWKKEDAE